LKLSRKVLLVIAAGVFVIILASLGMVAFQSYTEQSELKEQHSQIQSQLQEISLEQLTSQQSELKNQLNQAESQLESVRGILSDSVGSVDGATGIFKIAESYDLLVTEITSPGPDNENLEGVNFQVVSLIAEVNGNVKDLLKFTTDLNKYFTTGVIKTVTITVPDGIDTDNATASVQLVVYTYRGE